MDSAVHQVASASVAAVFSMSMLLAAHFFTEYRSSRMPAITLVRPPMAAVARTTGNGLIVAEGYNGAI
jgi:hypothetical protein